MYFSGMSWIPFVKKRNC